MANKGSLNGKQLISEETWNEMMSEPKFQVDACYALSSNQTKGGFNKFDSSLKVDEQSPYYSEVTIAMKDRLNDLRDGWYGWIAYGGSVIMFHPEHKMSLSYVPNDIYRLEFGHVRAANLQKLAVEAVEKMKEESKE